MELSTFMTNYFSNASNFDSAETFSEEKKLLITPFRSVLAQSSLSVFATAQSILDECVMKWTGAVDPVLTGIWDQETFCAFSDSV